MADSDRAQLQADSPVAAGHDSDDERADAAAKGNANAVVAGETTIDPALLKDLTEQANAVSESLTHLLGGLHVQLLATSHITLQSVEAYALGVDQVNKTVEKCVEETVALINKADELNANMAPIHQLAAQIKDIKRTLDILEAACK